MYKVREKEILDIKFPRLEVYNECRAPDLRETFAQSPLEQNYYSSLYGYLEKYISVRTQFFRR